MNVIWRWTNNLKHRKVIQVETFVFGAFPPPQQRVISIEIQKNVHCVRCLDPLRTQSKSWARRGRDMVLRSVQPFLEIRIYRKCNIVRATAVTSILALLVPPVYMYIESS